MTASLCNNVIEIDPKIDQSKIDGAGRERARPA
jgi:hypothetical protein